MAMMNIEHLRKSHHTVSRLQDDLRSSFRWYDVIPSGLDFRVCEAQGQARLCLRTIYWEAHWTSTVHKHPSRSRVRPIGEYSVIPQALFFRPSYMAGQAFSRRLSELARELNQSSRCTSRHTLRHIRSRPYCLHRTRDIQMCPSHRWFFLVLLGVNPVDEIL